MEEKKQGFLGKFKCLALFAAMMIVAVVIVLVKPMITGEAKYVGVGTSPIGGEVKVEVRIAKGEITAVNVLEHNETEGIGTNAIAQLPEAIVARQNIDVDVVATATLTSQAICEAVADAMTQAGMTPAAIPQPETQPAAEPQESVATGPLSAGTYTASAQGMGEVTVTITVDDAGTITDVSVEGPGETQGIGTNAIEQLPAAILEAQSADVDVVATATITSNAILSALRDCLSQAAGGAEAAGEPGQSAAGPLSAGTYTAAAQGMGEVTVTITVDDAGTITDVSVEGPGETQGIGTNAIEQLPAAILEAQSADVDVVATATITSNAILTALQDCLSQAGE